MQIQGIILDLMLQMLLLQNIMVYFKIDRLADVAEVTVKGKRYHCY